MPSVVGLCLVMSLFTAQMPPRPVFKLWPKGNPTGWTRPDKEEFEHSPNGDFMIVKGVSEPTLEIFRSKSAKSNAPTVLICPGGGYFIEAIEHEGWEIATRLNLAGIHAAVLKYRLPNRDQDKPLHKVPLEDAQRALRILRSSKELGFSPHKIGIMGFSAGGHLAAASSTAEASEYEVQDDADKLDCRPDFTVLIYPAYLDPTEPLKLADELTVTGKTPPVFIVQAMDDNIPIEGSLAYTHACHLAKVPVELHLFPHGGHGYGLRSHEPGLNTWPELLFAWLGRQ
jgi:acetyl esterase/lipase